MEHLGDGDNNCTVTKGFVQGLEDLEIRGLETIQTTSLLRPGRNEKSLRDLRRLAVTQIPVENHQLTMVLKTFKGVKKIKIIDKYLDLARELKKIWKMRVMVISVIVGELGTVPRSLEKGLEEVKISGKIWDQQEYWEESWWPEETYCHTDSSESPLANSGVKNLQGMK